MPVPDYLKELAYREVKRRDFTNFYLRCSCSFCQHFKLKKRRDNMPVEICISVEHS